MLATRRETPTPPWAHLAARHLLIGRRFRALRRVGDRRKCSVAILETEMPLYSFRCSKCGKQYEAFVKKVGQVAPCPACGDQQPDKLLSLIAALFGRSPARSLGERACRPRRGSRFG